ncbi:MAG: hypothetical protein WDA75_12805, partial [Candidatus Latescibacterota bacterium]
DLPLGPRGLKLLAAGLGTILVGYLLLRVPPVDGFVSLTLAPLLLVAGYCVLIPAALLAREAKDGPGR